jgi:hypothetical protein
MIGAMTNAMRGHLWLLVFLVASPVLAQTPATVTFIFDRPGLSVPHFILSVDESGHGRYQADELQKASPKFAQYAGAAETVPPVLKHIDRPLELSRATVESIFRTARAINRFNIPCAARMKNIANTGDKILSYTGSGGAGTCAYNYSENKSIVALTDTFESIAFTLDQGRKLDFDHRYDRLGLDEDMAHLVQAVDEKHALEVGTIAETLTSLIDDTAVMQRVRQRAATLLEQAKQTMQATN